MPKKPIDYSKTIIYKIVCKDITIKDCYVGHTTNFKIRKNMHNSACNNENNKNYHMYVYQFIREHNGWDNWDMIEIETCECKDFNDACKRERYWLETLGATLNKVLPTRTSKEWYEANKEQKLQKNKEWYEANKEQRLQKSKEWYEANKEQMKEKMKAYYEANKEQMKAYYEANKEVINEKRKEKIECECGGYYTRTHKARHLKTKKHQEYLANV